MSGLLLSWIGPVVMLNDGNGFGLQDCFGGVLDWVVVLGVGGRGLWVVVRIVRRGVAMSVA